MQRLLVYGSKDRCMDVKCKRLLNIEREDVDWMQQKRFVAYEPNPTAWSVPRCLQAIIMMVLAALSFIDIVRRVLCGAVMYAYVYSGTWYT